MTARARLALALAVPLAACAVGPQYHAPVPGAAMRAPFDTQGLGADTVSADDTPDAWWQLYHDPRLDRLIGEALAHNTDLRAAEANLAASAAALDVARANRLPSTTLSAGSTYGRTVLGDAIYNAFGDSAPNGWLHQLGFSSSWQVDLFGQIRRGIEAARADSGAAAAARDVVRVSIAASVSAAYADICALGRSIDVARRSADEADRALDATRKRAAAGIDNQFDLARAEALLAQTAASIAPLEGQRQVDLHVLTTLIGRAPAQAPDFALGCTAPLTLAVPVPIGDGAALIRRRPDVRLAERNAAAASARIGLAIASRYPQISLGGSFLFGAASLRQFDERNAFSWGLGPLVTWSFPDQAAAAARVAAARATDAAALARLDGAILGALGETREALDVYGAELTRRQQLRASADASTRAFHMATARFRDGASTYLDLLNAEQGAIAADAALAASDRQVSLDQIALFRALGGGWRQSPPPTTHDGAAS